MTQAKPETQPNTSVASLAPPKLRDPARENWRSVLLHPEEFAAVQDLQRAQHQPRFDLAALVSAAVALSLASPEAQRLIHAKAVADFKRRSA
jgi:hypothetical protein